MSRVEDLETLLQEVSDSCDTLTTFAAHAACRRAASEAESEANYRMVQAMAERIGAIAALAFSARNAASFIVGPEMADALVACAASRHLPEAP